MDRKSAAEAIKKKKKKEKKAWKRDEKKVIIMMIMAVRCILTVSTPSKVRVEDLPRTIQGGLDKPKARP